MSKIILSPGFYCGAGVETWDQRFAEPIVLPDGVKLASLREAIAYVVRTVPPSERSMPTVVTAAEMLTLAAEHAAPIEFARIATLQAINRNVERVFDPKRKDPHRGRRKLARDR